MLAGTPVPISSPCTADPFSGDGSSCTVAAVNAPFYLFTTSGSPQRLFGQALIGGVSCAMFPGCVVRITVSGGSAVIASRLSQSDPVGILVNRIVRFRKVHGVRTPVLKLVGRVPLGPHHKGKVKIHWDLKVGGHKLKPGKYLIVLRAFDSHKVLLGTTKPVIVTIG